MYSERAGPLPGLVAWSRVVPPGGSSVRVLPDGCLDVIWSDGTVFVAGPDTTAQVSAVPGGTRFEALRCAPGVGPGLLGVPAVELRDQRVPLADLWPAAAVRRLADAADPVAALADLARQRWRPPEPATAAVAAGVAAGRAVAEVAAAVGLSARQLHRRCLASFGYGPKTLARVLRLQRALDRVRSGTPIATVAALEGYADQAHLSRDVKDLAGVPLGVLLR
jgi:AraC-like DNA-binding protein